VLLGGKKIQKLLSDLGAGHHLGIYFKNCILVAQKLSLSAFKGHQR